MKQSLLAATLVFSILSFTATAQKDSSGVYKTAADFQQGKLAYAINYKTEKHKIDDNLLFKESEIKVKHEGMSYTLRKSETYGYRDTKGVDYRFVDNKAYRVLSKGDGVILYVYQSPASSTKGNVKYVPTYFFSKDIPSTPQALTKENLKAAFPGNHKFHDALDATFQDDKDLAAYDSFHKMYKVNHLLSASK
jgi:hypothetical protein